MSVIRKDIFLTTLIQDVSKWYDKWYMGDLITMKNLHIKILLLHYDSNRFKKCKNIHEEKILFLTEVQDIVNINVNYGGRSLWMN